MQVNVEEYKKNKFKIISTHSTVFFVIELFKNKKIELLEEDNNLIYNNYHSDEDFSDEEK